MTTAAYDTIAEWYDQSIRRGSWLHEAAVATVLDLAGNVAGKHLCDLACGQGVVTRQLAAHGATAVGIDLSEKLLAIARAEESVHPSGIRYRCDDAQTLTTVVDASFDGIVCNLALMDIPDLWATMQTVRRVLRPGAWFVFSITHPCLDTLVGRERMVRDGVGTNTQMIRNYFIEGPGWSGNAEGVRGRVGAHHRTVSTYLNMVVAAGLAIEHVSEPQAPAPATGVPPLHHDLPALLAVRCARTAS